MGGTTKSKQTTAVAFPPELRGVASILGTRAFEEAPYYSPMMSMYQNVMRTPPTIPEYISPTLEAMIRTGEPFSQTDVYKTAYPVYQRELDKAIAEAKEAAGVRGGLRSTAGAQRIGEAAATSAERFMQYLTDIARQSYEAAQARRLSAMPYAYEMAEFPTRQVAALSAIGPTLESARYPLLQAALQMATAGRGTTTTAEQEERFPAGSLLGTILSPLAWFGSKALFGL